MLPTFQIHDRQNYLANYWLNYACRITSDLLDFDADDIASDCVSEAHSPQIAICHGKYMYFVKAVSNKQAKIKHKYVSIVVWHISSQSIT